MAPRIEELSLPLTEQEDNKPNLRQNSEEILRASIVKKKAEFKPEIVWKNVAIFIVLHSMAIYGVYCCFYSKTQTLVFGKN